jgi:hypothetical protein
MKKIATTKAASQPSVQRRLAVRRKQQSPRHEAMARAIVARIDVTPDFTEICDAEEERALVAAFIEHHVGEDSKPALQSFETDQQREEAAIKAALPADLRLRFNAFVNRNDDMRWVKEEIAYALGVEVGRRLQDGAR